MKKKMTIAITIVCLVSAILASSVLAYAASTKPATIGFSTMAASIEKNYGTVFELDLTLRNGAPVYKANVIIDGKRVLVIFDALAGSEIERRDAVALDEDEAAIYNNYDVTPSTSGTVTQQPATTPSSTAQITYEKAKEIALAKVGGGTVREIKLDYENGILVYEVEIKYNGLKYEVDVNAATGEIVKYKSEYSSNTTTSQPSVQQSTPTTSGQQSSSTSTAQITYEKAKEIALAKVGGGTIKEIDLDYEKGRLVYEVEIKYNGREYELDIDAATGEIVKYKIDD